MIAIYALAEPDKYIDIAKKLGSLDQSTIWALISIVLFLALVYMIKQHSKAGEKAANVRVQEATAMIQMTSAIEKLANELQELRHSIKCKGDNNV